MEKFKKYHKCSALAAAGQGEEEGALQPAADHPEGGVVVVGGGGGGGGGGGRVLQVRQTAAAAGERPAEAAVGQVRGGEDYY